MLIFCCDIVATSIDNRNGHIVIGDKKKTKKKVSREKIDNSTEETLILNTQSGDLTYLLSVVFVSDVLVFGAVAATTESCVKINSTTKFLTQNKNKISIKLARTNTILKYTY